MKEWNKLQKQFLGAWAIGIYEKRKCKLYVSVGYMDRHYKILLDAKQTIKEKLGLLNIAWRIKEQNFSAPNVINEHSISEISSDSTLKDHFEKDFNGQCKR